MTLDGELAVYQGKDVCCCCLEAGLMLCELARVHHSVSYSLKVGDLETYLAPRPVYGT